MIVFALIIILPIYAIGAEPGCGDEAFSHDKKWKTSATESSNDPSGTEDYENDETEINEERYNMDESDHPIIGAPHVPVPEMMGEVRVIDWFPLPVDKTLTYGRFVGKTEVHDLADQSTYAVDSVYVQTRHSDNSKKSKRENNTWQAKLDYNKNNVDDDIDGYHEVLDNGVKFSCRTITDSSHSFGDRDHCYRYPYVREGRLYRFYSAKNGDHFYTTNPDKYPPPKGYAFDWIEGACETTQVSGTVPLYQYWNSNIKDHYYTTIWAPGYAGYQFQRTIGYVYPTKVYGSLIPLYRYWNPELGNHFLSKVKMDLNNPPGKGYVYEGIECYVRNLS